VDAVAVDAVLEVAPGECSDAERARAALEEALVAASAPRRHRVRPGHDGAARRWSVVVRSAVSLSMQASPQAVGKSLDAVIVDDDGAIVARRTLGDPSARTCLPLARAVGVWATLVLDAELARAKDEEPNAAAAVGSGGPSAPAPASASTAADARDGGRDSAGERPPPTASPRRTIEVGAMGYLRNGLSETGGVGGLSPFVTVEVSKGWVIRSSVMWGRSTSLVPLAPREGAMVSHLGGRLDFCRRIPGNYVERRGVELDLCAGAEGGVVTSDALASDRRTGTAGRAGIGPAANLRGELGSGLALEVRNVFGANLVATPILAEARPPLVFASAELGVSVRLP